MCAGDLPAGLLFRTIRCAYSHTACPLREENNVTTYTIPLGFSDDSVQLQMSMLSPDRLFHRGERVKLSGLLPRWANVQASDGKTYRVSLHPAWLEPAPEVRINNVPSDYLPPFPRWVKSFTIALVIQIVLSFLIVGGPVSGLVGVFAFLMARRASRAVDDPQTANTIGLFLLVTAWTAWALFTVYTVLYLWERFGGG
jgi:hypothetical protein